MRVRPAMLMLSAVVFLSAAVAGCGRSQTSSAEGIPLPYWTVARSETWAGTPNPTNRFMATVGQSELSSGLQESGFRGTTDIEWVPGPVRPGVHRTVTLTALKARIMGVNRSDNVVIVPVDTIEKGYQLVAVDMTKFRTGDLVEFRFENSQGTVLAVDRVLMEQPQ